LKGHSFSRAERVAFLFVSFCRFACGRTGKKKQVNNVAFGTPEGVPFRRLYAFGATEVLPVQRLYVDTP
jgi:hypothetical protein